MDKKTYIAPTALTVVFSAKANVLTTSVDIGDGDVNPEDFEVKEHSSKGINVWDEEW